MQILILDFYSEINTFSGYFSRKSSDREENQCDFC